MTKQYRWLELKIETYINDLGKPNPKLNGWAICPFARTYRDKTKIVIVEKGIKTPVETAFSMLDPLGLQAVVLAFPKKPRHSQIVSIVDDLLNLPQFDHIECLVSNHKLKGLWRGVYTGFDICDLVIVQNQQKLYWARQNLKKRGYYNQKNELG
jgi:hypothetical protein